MLSTRVLILDARFAQHRPHALAGMVADQQREQLVSVEPISLGSACETIDLDAGRVNNDVVHAQLAQPSMEPPAIASFHVDAVDLGPPSDSQALRGFKNSSSNGGRIAGGDRVPTHLASVVAAADRTFLVTEIKGYVQGRRARCLSRHRYAAEDPALRANLARHRRISFIGNLSMTSRVCPVAAKGLRGDPPLGS